MARPIIGLTGTFASGKDTFAHHLVKEENFLHISTGDMVRQEALKKRGSIERPVLHEVGTELRHQKGAGVLVDLAVQTFHAKQKERDDYTGLVVSGLRTLGEAKAIKNAGGFLLFVDAPADMRYERMRDRKRDDETQLSLEEFKANEAKELQTEGTDDADFNLLGIKNMSDAVIMNTGTVEEFISEAQRVISQQTT